MVRNGVLAALNAVRRSKNLEADAKVNVTTALGKMVSAGVIQGSWNVDIRVYDGEVVAVVDWWANKKHCAEYVRTTIGDGITAMKEAIDEG